jgi:hypothetical protein
MCTYCLAQPKGSEEPSPARPCHCPAPAMQAQPSPAAGPAKLSRAFAELGSPRGSAQLFGGPSHVPSPSPVIRGPQPCAHSQPSDKPGPKAL